MCFTVYTPGSYAFEACTISFGAHYYPAVQLKIKILSHTITNTTPVYLVQTRCRNTTLIMFFVLSFFFLLYISCAPIHSYWLPFMPCPPFEPIRKYQATILACSFFPHCHVKIKIWSALSRYFFLDLISNGIPVFGSVEESLSQHFLLTTFHDKSMLLCRQKWRCEEARPEPNVSPAAALAFKA